MSVQYFDSKKIGNITCSIRGTLGSLLLVNCNIGVLLAFIAGAYVDYRTIPYVMISLPIIFFIAFACMPDTPQHLLSVNKVEVTLKEYFCKIISNITFHSKEAELALRFYRNCSDDTISGCKTFNADFERMKAAKLIRDNDGTSFRLNDLCKYIHHPGISVNCFTF